MEVRPMQTLLVRLKPHDPRRGFVLRRYTYRGIKFHEERGWYRVDEAVADYLRDVHQVIGDEHSPPAFDVCSDEDAKAIDAREKEGPVPRTAAADDIKLSAARGAEATVTTDDLPDAATASVDDSKGTGRKSRGR
jgi:hypothetical protein